MFLRFKTATFSFSISGSFKICSTQNFWVLTCCNILIRTGTYMRIRWLYSMFMFKTFALSNFWMSHRTKNKFLIKDFFSKWDQIRCFLRIWSHLLKKSLMENFIFGCPSHNLKWMWSIIWPRTSRTSVYIFIIKKHGIQKQTRNNSILNLFYAKEKVSVTYLKVLRKLRKDQILLVL